MAQVADQDQETGPLDIVGLTEISEMCKVKHATTWRWRARGILIPEDGVVSGTPYWRRGRIVKWIQQTGRTGANGAAGG